MRAVRLPLVLSDPTPALEDVARLRAPGTIVWHEHKLGQGNGWTIAREDREIGDLSAYPNLVAVCDLVQAPRRQLWVSVLRAQSAIRPHPDSFRRGAVRVHVPLLGSGVFEVEGETYSMGVGELWAVDTVGRSHSARNDGASERIHLLVDVDPSPWLREHVPWL